MSLTIFCLGLHRHPDQRRQATSLCQKNLFARIFHLSRSDVAAARLVILSLLTIVDLFLDSFTLSPGYVSI